ncbi:MULTISPECIES: hypothetical protein [unclassified Shimia]|uniref:hypothetical protein n=1 Tax=unclassified Shimia TaxID=2630038 RepID=UPI0006CD04FC|nr:MULTISPECIES: hypothetical protein [unclassified Shimia]KPA21972.1 hypothetical protein shim_18580 [Shimia sp. SK013]
MPEPLTFTHFGRNRRTVMALGLAVLVLAGLKAVGTVTWILAILGIFAVPALIDVMLNPVSTFSLADGVLRWKSATQEAEMRTDQIRSARFDTRLDISVRATLQMVDGSKVRIPNDVLPSPDRLQATLEAYDIPVDRHHFRVI